MGTGTPIQYCCNVNYHRSTTSAAVCECARHPCNITTSTPEVRNRQFVTHALLTRHNERTQAVPLCIPHRYPFTPNLAAAALPSARTHPIPIYMPRPARPRAYCAHLGVHADSFLRSTSVASPFHTFVTTSRIWDRAQFCAQAAYARGVFAASETARDCSRWICPIAIAAGTCTVLALALAPTCEAIIVANLAVAHCLLHMLCVCMQYVEFCQCAKSGSLCSRFEPDSCGCMMACRSRFACIHVHVVAHSWPTASLQPCGRCVRSDHKRIKPHLLNG